MAWLDIPDSELDAESEIRDVASPTFSIFRRIRDRLTALFDDATGAPDWRNDAFTDNNIAGSALSTSTKIPPAKFKNGAVSSSGMISAGAVGVSKLAVGTGQMVWCPTSATWLDEDLIPTIPMINPGGIYFLGYRGRFADNGYTSAGRYLLVRFSGMGVSGGKTANVDYYVNQDTSSPGGAGDGSPVGLTYMLVRCMGAGVDPRPRAIVEVSYLEASPPYSLGGYEVPYFLYALIDPNGSPLAWWGAGAPPWAYNGPTDITPNHTQDGKPYRRRRRLPYRWEDTRGNQEKMEANLDAVVHGDFEDMEITPEFKNSDIRIVPQPFIPPPGFRVVLIDPLSNFVSDLRRMDLDGDTVGDVLNERYVDFGMEPMVGASWIPGVPVVRGRWRNT